MRQRGSATLRSAGGTALNAASYMSSTIRLARSPIAWVSTWTPARSARTSMSATATVSVVISPIWPGSSAYGASSAAPREPSAPSITILMSRTVNRPSNSGGCGPIAISESAPLPGPVIVLYRRTLMRPSAYSLRIIATSAQVPWASCNWVQPSRTERSEASCIARSSCASVASGTWLRTSACAASISIPVGCPSASRLMAPPGGAAVWPVTPAIRRAALLAIEACPSARVSTTGWSGAIRSRSWRVGKTGGSQNVSIQPRPVTHSPAGVRCTAESTRARNAALVDVPSRLRLSSRAPMPPKWAWASTKPG